jgi:tetratricopeptide (TPR) repeat protein
MPSHIDFRLGHWEAALIANEKAIAASELQPAVRPGDAYNNIILHNHHMLVYAAAMQGEERKSIETTREMLALVPANILGEVPEMIDGFFATPYEVALRFGRWDVVLSEPPPSESFLLTTALWRYARGVAFAAKGNTATARTEQKEFVAAKALVPKGARFRGNTMSDLLDIADAMLAGEIFYREGKVEPALSSLREATRKEDQLQYSEPPDWLVPTRHALGATLMNARRYEEAESVYQSDLKRHPENGWSLFGLLRSLQMQSKKAEAAVVKARFDKAWEHADFEISSSCCCLPDKIDASSKLSASPRKGRVQGRTPVSR